MKSFDARMLWDAFENEPPPLAKILQQTVHGAHREDCYLSDFEAGCYETQAFIEDHVTLKMNYRRGFHQIFLLLALLLGPALGFTFGPSPKSTKTEAEIKQAIIGESIASYKGSCPCPYKIDRAGRRCGARSAYSRPGGASPLCYESDVTQKIVDDYRKRHQQ